MHLNELEQLNGAYNKQVTELENQIGQLQVCTVTHTLIFTTLENMFYVP